MTRCRVHRGFMLITVLVVTAVGLLFGAGALLLFRYQCQLRVDRQHELEKLCAVRSALNYLRNVNDEDLAFRYPTGSSRDLGVVVKPVPKIFPSDSYKAPKDHPSYRHFFMERGDFPEAPAVTARYDENLDFEYGVIGATNLVMSNVGDNTKERGLAFKDSNATNGVKWWVNIGMRGTGGWLEEDYGRRYYFYLENCVGVGDNKAISARSDTIRLCLVRNVTNKVDSSGRQVPVGHQHGWPLLSGERALVFESTPVAGDNVAKRLYEYECRNGIVQRQELVPARQVEGQTLYNMGLQLAGDKILMFSVGNKGNKATYLPLFSKVVSMTPQTYAYFAAGAEVDNEGKIVKAPELRAVFEVEATSYLRESVPLPAVQFDYLTDFKVTRAYQFDIFIEHPHSVTNHATVGQKTGTYARVNPNYTVITYDTHGTENKGFRKDEREAERNRR